MSAAAASAHVCTATPAPVFVPQALKDTSTFLSELDRLTVHLATLWEVWDEIHGLGKAHRWSKAKKDALFAALTALSGDVYRYARITQEYGGLLYVGSALSLELARSLSRSRGAA